MGMRSSDLPHQHEYVFPVYSHRDHDRFDPDAPEAMIMPTIVNKRCGCGKEAGTNDLTFEERTTPTTIVIDVTDAGQVHHGAPMGPAAGSQEGVMAKEEAGKEGTGFDTPVPRKDEERLALLGFNALAEETRLRLHEIKGPPHRRGEYAPPVTTDMLDAAVLSILERCDQIQGMAKVGRLVERGTSLMEQVDADVAERQQDIGLGRPTKPSDDRAVPLVEFDVIGPGEAAVYDSTDWQEAFVLDADGMFKSVGLGERMSHARGADRVTVPMFGTGLKIRNLKWTHGFDHVTIVIRPSVDRVIGPIAVGVVGFMGRRTLKP